MKKTVIGLSVAGLLFAGFGSPVGAQALDTTTDTERASLLAQIESLTELIAELQEILSGSKGDAAFTHTVAEGSQNDSVRLLQEVLASDPAIYPEALVTGYFGPMTGAALMRFQQTWGLQVTGTFTTETRFVLNEVVKNKPVDQSTGDYLLQPDVRVAIAESVDEYRNKPTITDGRVAFSASPDFSFGARNSDVTTMQQIFATDSSIYPSGIVTGIHDISTAESIIRFQQKYGLPITGSADTATVNVLKSILLVNNSSQIRSNLLTLADTSPEKLIPNSTRELLYINTERDSSTSVVQVTATYAGAKTESFTVPASRARTASALATSIASHLGRPVADVTAKINMTTATTKELPESILFYIDGAGELGGTVKFRSSGTFDSADAPQNLNLAIPVLLGGRVVILSDYLSGFKTKLQNNTTSKADLDAEMHGIIAEVFDVSISQARTVNLDYVVPSSSSGA
jgi:peptidoglycan hydrolase-like protein with peptidoglycan-binding domain